MSITAVPLRPVAKGALTKLWIGLALLAVLAAVVAYAGTSGDKLADERLKQTVNPENFLAWNKQRKGVVTTPSGLQYTVIQPGEGPNPGDGDVALVAYEGRLADGKVFDKNEHAPLPVSEMVPGFSEGLKHMQRGGKYRLWIPSALAYGSAGAGDAIPPNALIVFDVTLIDFRSRAELEAQRQQMEQLQAAQQGQGGALPPGVVPPGN